MFSLSASLIPSSSSQLGMVFLGYWNVYDITLWINYGNLFFCIRKALKWLTSGLYNVDISFAARSEVRKIGQIKSNSLCSLPSRPLTTQPAKFGGKIQILSSKSAAFICAAALVSLVLYFCCSSNVIHFHIVLYC